MMISQQWSPFSHLGGVEMFDVMASIEVIRSRGARCSDVYSDSESVLFAHCYRPTATLSSSPRN